MKNATLSILFFCLLFLNLDAKQIKINVEGVIVMKKSIEKTTLIIKIDTKNNLINFPYIQSEIECLDSNNEKRIIGADEVMEVQFEYRGAKNRMISKKIPGSAKKRFVKLKINGPIKIFSFYKKIRNDPYRDRVKYGIRMEEKTLIQKGKQPLEFTDFSKFKKRMIEYVSDCDSLVKRIKANDFTFGNVEAVVICYNRDCF